MAVFETGKEYLVTFKTNSYNYGWSKIRVTEISLPFIKHICISEFMRTEYKGTQEFIRDDSLQSWINIDQINTVREVN